MRALLASPLGFLIGLSLGALGGGGSILAVPSLVYAAGQTPKHATTTSLVLVALTALIGMVPHWRARPSALRRRPRLRSRRHRRLAARLPLELGRRPRRAAPRVRRAHARRRLRHVAPGPPSTAAGAAHGPDRPLAGSGGGSAGAAGTDRPYRSRHHRQGGDRRHDRRAPHGVLRRRRRLRHRPRTRARARLHDARGGGHVAPGHRHQLGRRARAPGSRPAPSNGTS